MWAATLSQIKFQKSEDQDHAHFTADFFVLEIDRETLSMPSIGQRYACFYYK